MTDKQERIRLIWILVAVGVYGLISTVTYCTESVDKGSLMWLAMFPGMLMGMITCIIVACYALMGTLVIAILPFGLLYRLIEEDEC